MSAKKAVFVVISLFLGLGWITPIHAEEGKRLVVSPDGQYTTLDTALAAAQDGDTIEVHGGTHVAPLVIDKSVTIIGLQRPIIDGKGNGTIIHITAPDVTLQGFRIQNSGNIQFHEDAGILTEAARSRIENNQLENVLNGILINNAAGTIARNNSIHGMGDDPALRGDGIRVWYSDDVQLIGNKVTHGRDTLISYANNLLVQDNVFEDNRYGLHFMFNNNSQILHNVFQNNSVGAFLMYSTQAQINDNTFAYNRGPSGYGLALKDMDEVEADNNFFVGNRAGLYLDNSPSLYEGYNFFRGNVFAYNDVGMTALPAVARNVFTGNSYLENLQQVGTRGREMISRNVWSYEGVGNYWSDYAGYDKDGDGIGETPYQSDKLFESLLDTYPNLQLFTYSPAAQAIEFTSAAFPILRPQPKLVDDAPLMTYQFPGYLEANDGKVAYPLLYTAFGLMVGAMLLIGLAWVKIPQSNRSVEASLAKENLMIQVNNLTKKYGKHTILEKVSFNVQAGEAIALWGTNGAGKTTTLRCLLGITNFDGNITVNGLDVKRNSKKVRAAIGYVPQEAVFYDLTVEQTVAFYASLKKVSKSQIQVVLERVNLWEHAAKPVRALSGGMKQRLALAISLLGNPPVLILDEPTANLDAQARYDFLMLIQSLNHDGKTIIFSTHRFDEVMTLATRVIVLRENHLDADCLPHQLTQHLQLDQWLRVWIPQVQWQMALDLLREQGFLSSPNGRAVYVQLNTQGKMAPLRLLEMANIQVDDFDLVDAKFVPKSFDGGHHA